MNAPRKALLLACSALLLAGWGTGHVTADPASHSAAPHFPQASAIPSPSASSSAASLPDYGGRDGGMAGLGAGTAPDMNPASQALRAFEALVVVLALIAGGVYGVKRLGLVNSDGKFSPGTIKLPRQPRREGKNGDGIIVQSSQVLPGGAGLHVVCVEGRTLLLGATGQSVSLLAELSALVPEEAAAPRNSPFADLMEREQVQNGVPALSAAADRLQTILARSRAGVTPSGFPQ